MSYGASCKSLEPYPAVLLGALPFEPFIKSIYLLIYTSPGGSELECLPRDWEVGGSTTGRIGAVIKHSGMVDCQSPC